LETVRTVGVIYDSVRTLLLVLLVAFVVYLIVFIFIF
jgi:hypothetical protein